MPDTNAEQQISIQFQKFLDKVSKEAPFPFRFKSIQFSEKAIGFIFVDSTTTVNSTIAEMLESTPFDLIAEGYQSIGHGQVPDDPFFDAIESQKKTVVLTIFRILLVLANASEEFFTDPEKLFEFYKHVLFAKLLAEDPELGEDNEE